MKQAFLGLAVADVLVLGAAAAMGWITDGGERLFVFHFALGLFGAIYTVFLHVVAYLYFIVASKIVTEAVERAGSGSDLADRASALKTHTFRFALLGIVTVIATAILGARIASVGIDAQGGADPSGRATGLNIHLVAAIITMVTQLIVVTVEYHTIETQSELTAQALAALEAGRDPDGNDDAESDVN